MTKQKIKIVRTPEMQILAATIGAECVPVAHVSGGAINSLEPHYMYPLVGWVMQRPSGWPSCMLYMSVLGLNSTTPMGTLTLSMPIGPLSERHVCRLLEDFGWDGRCWPSNHGDSDWPSNTEDQGPLSEMLRLSNLGATLTFPPKEQGNPTILIDVSSTILPYTVHPYRLEVGPPEVTYLEELRTLASHPEVFSLKTV